MKTIQYSNKINQLRIDITKSILNYFNHNNIIKVKLEDSPVGNEDVTYKIFTIEGAFLVMDNIVYENMTYDKFTIEELNDTLQQLQSENYNIIEKDKTHTAYKMAVWEYERGWGSKLDDYMICLTKEDALAFKEEFNSYNTEKQAPDWYMIAKDEPIEVELNSHQYQRLIENGKIWESRKNY